MSAHADPDGAAPTGDGPRTADRLRRLPSRLLSLAAMYADRLVGDGLATAHARKWHYAVLAVLEEFGPASQAALSTRTGIHRSDLVAVINELADRDLVERAPDPADRRRNVVTMTPQGRRHLHRLDRLLAGVQDDLLTPLTGPERDELVRLLTRLLEHGADAAPRHPHGNDGHGGPDGAPANRDRVAAGGHDAPSWPGAASRRPGGSGR